jgi:hypothetical protein
MDHLSNARRRQQHPPIPAAPQNTPVQSPRSSNASSGSAASNEAMPPLRRRSTSSSDGSASARRQDPPAPPNSPAARVTLAELIGMSVPARTGTVPPSADQPASPPPGASAGQEGQPTPSASKPSGTTKFPPMEPFPPMPPFPPMKPLPAMEPFPPMPPLTPMAPLPPMEPLPPMPPLRPTPPPEVEVDLLTEPPNTPVTPHLSRTSSSELSELAEHDAQPPSPTLTASSSEPSWIHRPDGSEEAEETPPSPSLTASSSVPSWVGRADGQKKADEAPPSPSWSSTSEAPPPPEPTPPQRAGRKKLPKPAKLAPEPALDQVEHKLHRSTAERLAGPALGWIAKRSQGWGSVLGGVVNEAPATAQGKPELVKPDDKANVEGRIQEIGQRTEQLVAHLDQQPAEHAPVGRKKKKGMLAKIKGAILGATSLPTLAGKLQPGKPAPASTALAAAAGLPGETLRAQVERHAAAVKDAEAALAQATEARKNASYIDRPARTKAEKKCRAALEEAVAAHHASLTMLEAGEAAERVSQNTATLAKVSYAAGELERYQSELGKLVVPGQLPGPADRWTGRLHTLAQPLANLIGQLELRAPELPGEDGEPEAVEQDNPALDPIAKASMKAAQQLDQLGAALSGASSDAEAQAAVLQMAEDVLGQTESVYLALSKAVKSEQRALLIADAHVTRLQNLLNADEVEDEPALRSALDTALALREGTQATVGLLREARTAMKKDIAQVRETYHAIAHEATTAAAEVPDAAPTAAAAATVAETVATATTSHADQFADARTRQSAEKKLQRATERERMDAAVENLTGFAPTTDAAGAEALRAQLRVAQAGLDPKRQGTDLAPSTVLKSLTSALSQVTGGDPARAARAAQALTGHSVLHWMDDTPTDDPTVNDVRQLHRLMSTMPRGLEVLARLSMEPASLDKRENVAASRGNVSALRTYWVADNALAQADPADAHAQDTQAWLGAAKAMAARTLSKALGTAGAEGASSSAAAAEPTPLQQAAFNGVRNGYLTRAPGSPYDKARTMLDKLSTQWTVAPDRHKVPLDENLSSNQIRAAAGVLADFVEALPTAEKRTEDSVVRAFAAFSARHPELHARSKLTSAHLAELTAMTLPPRAQLQGRQDDAAEEAAAAVISAVCVLPDEVLAKGMPFSDALAAVARLAKRSHPEATAQAALAEAMDDFKPGTGERKTGFGTKLANSVGTAVSSALAPTTNPLNDFGMQRLNAMSSGLGMNTRAKMAADQLQAALGALQEAAGAADQGGIALLCDGLRRVEGDAAVNGRLSREYAKALQQRLADAGHDLVVRTDIPLREYATELLQQLRAAGGDGAPALADDVAGDIEAALTSANRLSLHPDLPSVKTLDDLADVVTQFVSEDELRDKRKVFNGHEFGVSLPLNPFSMSGVPLGATVKYSRKKEEMLEVGMYINLAEVTTHKGEFGVSAGLNSEAHAGDAEPFNIGLGGGLTGALERQEATTLSLRLPRQRGTEAKLREQVPQIMKDLAEFAAQTDDEHEHPDALSLLLARHQDLAVVVTDDQGAWTKTAEARANFLNFAQKADTERDATIGGTALGISASLEYASEWKKESVGGFTTNDFTSSVKANISGDTGFRLPVKVDDHSKTLDDDGDPKTNEWKLRPPGVGTALLGGFRNFYQRLDKMQISEATAEGATIDADTDEFAFSPETLLQDLQDNREAWLERGLNVLMKRKPAEVEPHQRDTVGRRLAEAELVQFEEAIKDMAKNEKFTQYNVNYSLNDAAKARLGDLRLEEELARAAGDTATADRLAGEHIALLQAPASWEPNKVMARVKAKVPVNLGVDMVVKAKTTFQVEGQRVPWQYPA